MRQNPTPVHWRNVPAQGGSPLLLWGGTTQWYLESRENVRVNRLFPWCEEFEGWRNTVPPQRAPNRNRRLPIKSRKYVHRMHHAMWEYDWYNHAHVKIAYQSPQPEPDGA